MLKEPKELIEARAALSDAEEVLTNSGLLPRFRRGISLLADFIVGDDGRLKDVANNLVTTYRLKVLSRINSNLSEIYSHSDESLEHWENVLKTFIDAGLDDNAKLMSCRMEILKRLNARLRENSLPRKLEQLEQSLRNYLTKKT